MKRKLKKSVAWVLLASTFLTIIPPINAFASVKVIKPTIYKNSSVATSSNADKNKNLLATPSIAMRSNSLGDIWDSWSGITSFEFLNGNQGLGTEEKPFLIKNKAQLMGLSELTAMGMTVEPAAGVNYSGDYSGSYFALAGNIDLQGVDWIPIGFYGDSSERAGEVRNEFQGHFDGKGYIIKNLKLNKFGSYNNIGLFGVIHDAVIENITIIPDNGYEIRGNDQTGVLVGTAVDSQIRNITIKNANISSSGISGGIAGEITNTVIENAICEKVMINATSGAEIIYVGGIAGIASDSIIADSQVSTGTNNTSRIQGTGYVGGIVGYQNATDIFNTYISGTIGGYHSIAIGGVTGQYSSGKIKVARFAGTIGNSQLGSMAREGTFLGTREGAATNFNYIEDLAYLFADSESKISANVCGSEIPDDNDYTYDAHIGYWHDNDLFYTLVQGGTSKKMSDQYFYEELEEGILTVMDEEMNDRYTIDHFAPNDVGRPVRGYLITVNQIDTIANGQNYYDVAVLEVRGSSQYSPKLTKDNRGAIAAGSTVYVTTTPNNTDTEKFQLEGSPFYYNQEGKKKNTTYSESSHCYTFTMPAKDSGVSAIYKKVAVSVKVDPEIYNFVVTQTRTGNRKSPVKVTEIKNKEGKLIARYINGVLETGTQVQPVNISATIDANNDVADNKIKWSIDDPELIALARNDDEGVDGYSAKSASIAVNLEASFFTTIIQEAERKQAQGNYQYKIPNTIYGAGHQNGGVVILTAETRPSTSFEGKPCTANSRINVTFQIIDNTLVATEGAALDKQALTYTVTRTLTGDRISPEEKITVTAPQSLTATFNPDFFSREEVVWTSSDTAIVSVSQDQTAYKEASVSALKDAKWIRDIMSTDNGVLENDPYAKISGNGSRTVTVTVNAKDKLGNQASAVCEVTVNFMTDDQTRIVPEGIKLDKNDLVFVLGYQKSGDINSETIAKTGFNTNQISATVLPDLQDIEGHRPYDRTVVWTSSDPTAVTVDQNGNVTPVDNAPWIKEAISKAPYYGEKEVVITAKTKDREKSATCSITLTFQAECIEADRDTQVINIVLKKTGRRSNPTYTWTGLENLKFNAAIYSDDTAKKAVIWNSSNTDILAVDEEGNVKPVVLNEKNEVIPQWIKAVMNSSPYSATTTVNITASSADISMKDTVEITLNFKVNDQTTSGGSSGGSGGGGGGGSSTGITSAGKIQGPAAPSGSVIGTWTQVANGKWIFATDRTYASEWAYIGNPYATGDQPKASWFYFDSEGYMVTGWFKSMDGNIYYLNMAQDGTQGMMVTSWKLIDGFWYYFNPSSDGTKGRLFTNTVIDEVYRVNDKGQWEEKK